MDCPKCRYRNPPSTAFCRMCGEPLRRVEAAPAKERPNPFSPPPAAVAGLQQGGPVRRKDPDHFLVCAPYQPIRLRRERECVIGRDLDNMLVLPAGIVSRKHARIQWKDAGFVVADLGSANGTFVNGEKVRERELKAGDKITIGTFEIEFLEVFDDGLSLYYTSSKKSPQTTMTLDFREVKDARSYLEGTLTGTDFQAIFKGIGEDHKSGVLFVEADGEVGKIGFIQGRPLMAEFRGLRGAPAVAALLSVRQGKFRFDAKEQIPQANLHLSLEEMVKLAEVFKGKAQGEERTLLNG